MARCPENLCHLEGQFIFRPLPEPEIGRRLREHAHPGCSGISVPPPPSPRARLASVVAVWPDGGVSSHRDLAFRYQVLPSGQKEEPVTTFVADGRIPSVTEIRDRIKRARGVVAAD